MRFRTTRRLRDGRLRREHAESPRIAFNICSYRYRRCLHESPRPAGRFSSGYPHCVRIGPPENRPPRLAGRASSPEPTFATLTRTPFHSARQVPQCAGRRKTRSARLPSPHSLTTFAREDALGRPRATRPSPFSAAPEDAARLPSSRSLRSREHEAAPGRAVAVARAVEPSMARQRRARDE